MKKQGIAWIFALGMLVLLVGCGEDRTPVTKLNDEVMELHDTAMAKMDVIYAVTKDLKARKEAFEQDSANVEAHAEVLTNIDSAIEALDMADAGMFDWMAGYQKPAEETPVAEALEYLEGEKVKVTKVAEDIDNSIAEGKALLEQNPAPEVEMETEE